jgi:hypothetical protein
LGLSAVIELQAAKFRISGKSKSNAQGVKQSRNPASKW